MGFNINTNMGEREAFITGLAISGVLVTDSPTPPTPPAPSYEGYIARQPKAYRPAGRNVYGLINAVIV